MSRASSTNTLSHASDDTRDLDHTKFGSTL